MSILSTYLDSHPIVPYIRQCDLPYRKPYRHGERRLLDYLLVYVQRGTFELFIHDTMYQLQDGDYCLIQPNVLHYFGGLTETITPYAHFDVFYTERRTESFPTRPGQTHLVAYSQLMQPVLNDFDDCKLPVVFRPNKPEIFRNMFISIIEQWRSGHVLARQEAHHNLARILLQIISDFTKLRHSESNNNHQFLEWIPSYLSLHLAEPISIQNMADSAHLSPSRFAALFQRRFSMSPHQYLLHMRINHGKELLLNTDLDITRIAEYCGFKNIYHFSKMFKQSTTISPKQYRIAMKQNEK
jgi:AraC-like DNA-binding protein